MLEITTILNPFGWDVSRKSINKVFIANNGLSKNGDENTYDYLYIIYEEGSKFSEGILEHGIIKNHRQNQSSLYLLREVLLDFGQSKCKMSESFLTILKNEEKL